MTRKTKIDLVVALTIIIIIASIWITPKIVDYQIKNREQKYPPRVLRIRVNTKQEKILNISSDKCGEQYNDFDSAQIVYITFNFWYNNLNLRESETISRIDFFQERSIIRLSDKHPGFSDNDNFGVNNTAGDYANEYYLVLRGMIVGDPLWKK